MSKVESGIWYQPLTCHCYCYSIYLIWMCTYYVKLLLFLIVSILQALQAGIIPLCSRTLNTRSEFGRREFHISHNLNVTHEPDYLDVGGVVIILHIYNIVTYLLLVCDLLTTHKHNTNLIFSQQDLRSSTMTCLIFKSPDMITQSWKSLESMFITRLTDLGLT